MKIGVFDSGLGGLTVVKALQDVIKGDELFYIADTKNAPYGEKTSEQILQYSLDITRYLINEHQIDALIVACNTATSAAIETLRTLYPDLIILGTEPGLKPAIEKTKTGRVGVLATPATLKGKKYQELTSTLVKEKEVKLFEQACPGLVEQIEKGEASSQKTREMLSKWLTPMRDNDVDCIVLGCTHYPLVQTVIEELMQRDVHLIHTGDAIARHLLDLGKRKGYKFNGNLFVHVYYTGDIELKEVRKMINVPNSIEEKKISII